MWLYFSTIFVCFWDLKEHFDLENTDFVTSDLTKGLWITTESWMHQHAKVHQDREFYLHALIWSSVCLSAEQLEHLESIFLTHTLRTATEQVRFIPPHALPSFVLMSFVPSYSPVLQFVKYLSILILTLGKATLIPPLTTHPVIFQLIITEELYLHLSLPRQDKKSVFLGLFVSHSRSFAVWHLHWSRYRLPWHQPTKQQ